MCQWILICGVKMELQLKVRKSAGKYIFEYYDQYGRTKVTLGPEHSCCYYKFEHLSQDEIAQLFSQISRYIQSIRLEIVYDEEYVDPCSEYPSSSTANDRKRVLYLDYFNNLIEAIRHLPKTIKEIKIGKKILTHYSAEELGTFFASIPRTVSTLDLTSNELLYSAGRDEYEYKYRYSCIFKRIEDLGLALRRLPKNVHTLCLSSNTHYHATDIAILVGFFPDIPNTVTELDISSNGFCPPSLTDADYIFSKLPGSIHTVRWKSNVHFHHEVELGLGAWDAPLLGKTLASLPPTVTSLDLSSNEFYRKSGNELATIFRGTSLNTLNLSDNDFYKKTKEELAAFFVSLPQSLQELDISDNKFGRTTGDYLSMIFANLARNITRLNLSSNELYKLSGIDLSKALASLPPTVTILNLSKNELCNKTKDELIAIFSNLNPSIKVLDLSLNRLFTMECAELIEVFQSIASSIKVLKLKLTFPYKGLAYTSAVLSHFPTTIEALDLSDNKLSYLKDSELSQVLNALPSTIERIDLSTNSLYVKGGRCLKEAFSKLPARLNTLKLCNNNLATLSLLELEEAFSSLLPTITCLDLSDNGFENLPTAQLNKILSFIPYTVTRVRLYNNDLKLRNDGKLIARSFGKYPLPIYRPLPHVLTHQAKFAELRLPMLQWISSRKCCFDIVCLIMSFILNESPINSRRMSKKFNEAILPVTIPKTEERNIAQQKSLRAVQRRIDELSEGSRLLDLSRCGLNRIYEFNILGTIFQKLPKSIHTLNLRGNGFSQENGEVVAIKGVLKLIPQDIICLDLSDNGLERLNSTKLQELFLNLPKTVILVTLNQTKPIHPLHLIAQKHWPKYYQEIVKSRDTSMQNSRVILKNYADKKFNFCYFMRGKGCAPPYKEEVKDIIQRIDTGEIASVPDLIEAIEEIDAPDENHSLMKRLRFIENIGSQAEHRVVNTARRLAHL